MCQELYLQQVKKQHTQADQSGLFACSLVYSVESAPEACIHAAEHDSTAGLLRVQVAQGSSILYQTPAQTYERTSAIWSR